jgi:hypothetical protein
MTLVRVPRCNIMPLRLSQLGHSRPGSNQQQVQPCPLFADRYRGGKPLKPTRRARSGLMWRSRTPLSRGPPNHLRGFG